jgi:hypothetical protein
MNLRSSILFEQSNDRKRRAFTEARDYDTDPERRPLPSPPRQAPPTPTRNHRFKLIPIEEQQPPSVKKRDKRQYSLRNAPPIEQDISYMRMGIDRIREEIRLRRVPAR